jgi:type I restriction enzyme S subunit
LCITIAANIGETGILTYPACFPDSVVGFSHDGDPVTVRFVELFFRIAKSELDRLAPATAQKNINVDILSKLRIPFPPLPEQRRIVAEIEKQFTRLEAGVAALRRVQANLKRYRVAVLKAACEGKLVPTEAELHRVTAASRRSAAGKQSRDGSATFETGAELLTRILAERRKNWTGRGKYKEPAAPDLSAVASAKGDTANLPPLPEGWTWATFGQLCRIQGGFAFKSSDYAKEGIPLVRISNLVNGRVQVAEDTVFLPQSFADANPDFLLRKGDVLIAMSGATAGKMATMEHELPALLNQRIGRFVLSAAELSNSKFISLLVQQIGAKVLKDAYGAAQPNISPSEIEEMPVPLPPLAEQTRIVAEVERRLSVVEELVSVVSANLQRAVRLRQSILHKAFTGEL